MIGYHIFSLLLVTCIKSLPQIQGVDDPWLAVINGNNNDANDDTNKQTDDADFYQFEDQNQRQPPPGYGYPDPAVGGSPDNRRVGQQPGRYQPPAPAPGQQQVRRPIPDNRRVAQPQVPPQRRLPPPGARAPPPPQGARAPPPPPAEQGGGILDTVVNGVKGVASGVSCAATNLIADDRLNDENFIRSQMDCAMNRAPCDEIGRQIKILAPEVLAGRCPAPCNPCIKNQIRRVMSELSQRYPREFQQMMAQLSGRVRG